MRSAARLLAVQALYQSMLNDQDAGEVAAEYLAGRAGMIIDGEEICAPDKKLFTSIIGGVEKRRSDMDEIVAAHLDGKQLPEKLLQSILLCGCYEVLAHHDIDPPIIINDYIDVAKAFYGGGEPKLVNAVLDRAVKNLRD